MSITSRLVDAARATPLFRNLGDRVARVADRVSSVADEFVAPPPRAEPEVVRAPAERIDVAPRSGDLLERAVNAPAMTQALASGLYSHDVSPRRGSDEMLELYQEAPWLRSVSHKVASGVAAVEWKLYARRSEESRANPEGPLRYVRDDRLARMPLEKRHAAIRTGVDNGELDEITAHPFLRLLDRPNPTMSGFAARLVTVVHLDLLGDAFWIVDVDDDNRPVRFWPIPSHWVQSIPTPAEPWFRVRFPDFEGNVPAHLMMWFRDVNPGDPYSRGTGLGLTLADEIDTDEMASKTVKGFFENGAVPQVIVSLKGARQEVVDRAQMKWQKALGGFKKAYKTFFTGAELSVERLDTTFKDMGLVELRKNQRNAVIQVWGAPPEKLGIIENSNRANIDGADLIWGKEVLTPRCELMRLEFQRIVMRWDPRLIVDYVSPIPEDIERQRGIMTTQAQQFTIDEMRALAGLPPLPNKAGEGFLVQPTTLYVRSLETLAQGTPMFAYHISAGIPTNNEVREKLGLPLTKEPWGEQRTTGFYNPLLDATSGAKPQALPAPGEPANDDEPKPDDAPEVADAKAEARARRGEGATAARAMLAAAARLDAARTEFWQGGAMWKNWHIPRETFDDVFVDKVIGMPGQTRRRRGKRASALTVKNLRAVLGQIDINSMAAKMQPVVEDLVRHFGDETLQAIESTKRFDMQDPLVADHIRELLQDRIGRLINVTTTDNLRGVMTSWDGNDDEELVSAVRGVFDVARVERSQAIAETEGQRSKEFATHVAMRQSGIVERKEWVAVGDSRTREAHLAMDGQMRDINEPFEVPSGKWAGSKAQTPGSFGIAALDIRCRCQSAPVFDLDAEAPDTERTRLMDAGIVVAGATPEERAKLWRAQDQKLRSWETKLSDASSDGFDEQEQRVVDKLLEVLG